MVICASLPPIRLSLCRERLAWGVPHRATLLTPQQDVVKHAAWEIRILEKHCPCQQFCADPKCNAQIYICIIIVDTYRGRQNLSEPKFSIVKYKKFVSLSDPRTG